MTEYDSGNIFARILRGEAPSQRVYEDDEFIAFRDIAPKAPVHILIIPRHEGVTGPAALGDDDSSWMGRMVVAATKIARAEGLEDRGYRLVMNNGRDAHQEVPHIHLHILGGASLDSMA